MTDIYKAAQQALEALEDHAKQYPHMQKGYTVDAITALRTALAEQPAEQEPFTVLVRKHSWLPNQWEAAPCGFPDYGKQWADERINVYTAPQLTIPPGYKLVPIQKLTANTSGVRIWSYKPFPLCS